METKKTSVSGSLFVEIFYIPYYDNVTIYGLLRVI